MLVQTAPPQQDKCASNFDFVITACIPGLACAIILMQFTSVRLPAGFCLLCQAARRAAELQGGEIEAGPVGSASLRPQTHFPDAAALLMLGGLRECFSPGQWSSISPDPLGLLGPASSPSVLLEKPK